MTIASASRARVAYVPETAFGTTPTTPSFVNMRRTTGNMRSKKGTAVSDEIQLDRNVRAEYMLSLDPEGSYAFELSYGSFDVLLAAALFGTWTSNVLTNGVTEQSFTFEETVDIGGGSFLYSRFTGTEISSLALTLNSRQSIKGTLNVMGQAEATDTAILTGATYAASNTNSIITAAQVGSLTVSGVTPAPKVKNLTLNVANNLRIRDKVGSLYTDSFGIGQADVTGTLDCYFETNALYNQVLAHGTAALSCTIGSVTAQKYTIAMPVIQFLDGARTLAGKNDDVMVSIPFRAIYDSVSGGSINITRAVA